jgi:hypothetical protein
MSALSRWRLGLARSPLGKLLEQKPSQQRPLQRRPFKDEEGMQVLLTFLR